MFHVTPKSAARIDAAESFFSIIARRRIRRGVFKSVADLRDAIARYIRAHNKAAKPFVCTSPSNTIFAKLDKPPAASE